MTLLEILKINNVFRNAIVIAGEEGLEHDVSSVMVLEAPAIENWGRKGQLLLTSFFALHALTEEQSQSFLGKCESLGISGLVLKMGRLISEIPAYFSDYCNRYQIPLILLPQDVKYETIIISVLEPIIRQIPETMSRLQTYNALANDLLSGQLKEHSAIDQALHYLKLDKGAAYQVILLELPLPGDSLFEKTALVSHIFSCIREEFEAAHLPCVHLPLRDRMTVICALPDSRKGNDTAKRLEHMMEQLWSTGQNFTETASLLFLHPKTVKYRIGKVQQILSLDLANPETIFRILLDERLFKIREHRSSL